jgi:hypothetical protein
MSRRSTTAAATPVDSTAEAVVDVAAFVAECEQYAGKYKFKGRVDTGVRKADMTRLFADAVLAVGGPVVAEQVGLLPVVRDHLAAVCDAYGTASVDVFSRPAARYHSTACGRCDNDAKTHRSWRLIGRIGRVLSPDTWRQPEAPAKSRGSSAVYHCHEIDWFTRLPLTLPPDKRFAFEVVFWLAYAFGADADAIAFAHADDFRPIFGGAWTFKPSTGDTRTVPCPSEHGPRIAELVEARHGRYVLPTADHSIASGLLARNALRPREFAQAQTETPTVARLASTWRWQRLLCGLNPAAITRLCGHQTMSWLNDMPSQSTGLTLTEFEVAQQSPTKTQLAIPFHQSGDHQ